MKKLSFAALLIVSIVAISYCLFGISSRSVDAQERSKNRKILASAETDRQMAAEITQLTDRTQQKIKMQRGRIVESDLNGGYQNVALARMGEGEHIEGYCVADLAEANAFFGRDLNTGNAVPRIELPKYDMTKLAADHGMSLEEYVVYSRMAAEFAAMRSASPQSSSINIVNNNAAGVGFNDTSAAFVVGEGGNNGTTKGEQRLNVFLAAAAIWGNFLDSSVPIQVRSQMTSQTCSTSGAVLGSAGSTTIHANFANAPFTNTWYNQALSNKLSGGDRNTGQPDISATFNVDIDNSCLGGSSRWYYGLDNATPSQRINLLVVLLHEMGHGLGFQTFANGSAGTLNSGIPDQWSRMMFDNATGLHWDAMTDTQRQASALSNGGLLWDGPNAVNASNYLTNGIDGSGRIRLYAPTTFQSGSSVSHYDTVCFPNVLMEPAINVGLPIDLDLTRQLMRDIGWYRDTTADLVPDTITSVAPSSGFANIGSATNITWTNNGGFNRNVTIELSTDGGATYPTAIATNIANTGSFSWTVPNVPTTTARIRVREANFLTPIGISSANFEIRQAVNVTISGQVLTTAGRPIRRATVTLTGGPSPVQTTVNSFGAFTFQGLPAGVTYTVTASGNARYTFDPRPVTPQSDVAGLNITGR